MRLVSVRRDGGLLVSIVGGRPVLSLHVQDLIWEKDDFGAQGDHGKANRPVPCTADGCARLVVTSPGRSTATSPHSSCWPHELRRTRWTRPTRSWKHFPGESVLDPRLLRRVEAVLGRFNIPRGLFRPEGGVSTRCTSAKAVPRDMLTLSGRYKGESHRAYCRRMPSALPANGDGESEPPPSGSPRRFWGPDPSCGGRAPCPGDEYGDTTLHARCTCTAGRGALRRLRLKSYGTHSTSRTRWDKMAETILHWR